MSFLTSKHDDIVAFASYVEKVAFLNKADRLPEVRKWATMTENILRYVESIERSNKSK